jgi:hypothetical protein
MTRDEILNTKAGRDMDALIAVCVCGWCVDDMTATSPTGSRNSRTAHGDDDWLPYYSTDISAAWQIIENFENQTPPILCNISPRISNNGKHDGLEWHCHLRQIDGANTYCYAIAETVPLAICADALLAVNGGV